jgi:hypothetical protein
MVAHAAASKNVCRGAGDTKLPYRTAIGAVHYVAIRETLPIWHAKCIGEMHTSGSPVGGPQAYLTTFHQTHLQTGGFGRRFSFLSRRVICAGEMPLGFDQDPPFQKEEGLGNLAVRLIGSVRPSDLDTPTAWDRCADCRPESTIALTAALAWAGFGARKTTAESGTARTHRAGVPPGPKSAALVVQKSAAEPTRFLARRAHEEEPAAGRKVGCVGHQIENPGAIDDSDRGDRWGGFREAFHGGRERVMGVRPEVSGPDGKEFCSGSDAFLGDMHA